MLANCSSTRTCTCDWDQEKVISDNEQIFICITFGFAIGCLTRLKDKFLTFNSSQSSQSNCFKKSSDATYMSILNHLRDNSCYGLFTNETSKSPENACYSQKFWQCRWPFAVWSPSPTALPLASFSPSIPSSRPLDTCWHSVHLCTVERFFNIP